MRFSLRRRPATDRRGSPARMPFFSARRWAQRPNRRYDVVDRPTNVVGFADADPFAELIERMTTHEEITVDELMERRAKRLAGGGS